MNGLRPRSDMPLNAPYTQTHDGMMACERRGRQLPALTWPGGFPTESSSWPPSELFYEDGNAEAVIDNEFFALDASALTSSQQTVYGFEGNVLSNGNFTGAATDWTLGTGIAYASNAIAFTAASATAKQALADMAVPWGNGGVYEVVFTVGGSVSGNLTVGTNTDATQGGAAVTSPGTYTRLVTADAHADGLVFTATGFTGTLDVVSARRVFTPTGAGPWHFAGMRGSWFATNATSFVFSSPGNDGGRVICNNSTMAVQSVCNWNNRLVLGGLSGSRFSTAAWLRFYARWFNRDKKNVMTDENDAIGTNWLLLGPRTGGDVGIPNANLMALLGMPNDTVYETVFEPDVKTMTERAQIDLLPLRHTGAIKGTALYGGDLIVFGDAGISRIRETEIGPVEEQISPVGIWGRGAFAGGKLKDGSFEHLAVGLDGYAYMVGQGAMRYAREGWHSPEMVGRDCYRLGWAEFVGAFTAGDTMRITHDPTEHRYWIAEEDDAYLLTDTGLSHSLGVVPSSAVRLPGSANLIGSAITDATGGDVVTVKTVPMDLGRRDPFTMERIDCSATDTATDPAEQWKITPHGKLQRTQSERTFPAVDVDTRGVGAVEFPAVEHAYTFAHGDRTKCTMDDATGYADLDKNPSLRQWLTVEEL
jgi:hypothetical protein